MLRTVVRLNGVLLQIVIQPWNMLLVVEVKMYLAVAHIASVGMYVHNIISVIFLRRIGIVLIVMVWWNEQCTEKLIIIHPCGYHMGSEIISNGSIRNYYCNMPPATVLFLCCWRNSCRVTILKLLSSSATWKISPSPRDCFCRCAGT